MKPVSQASNKTLTQPLCSSIPPLTTQTPAGCHEEPGPFGEPPRAPFPQARNPRKPPGVSHPSPARPTAFTSDAIRVPKLDFSVSNQLYLFDRAPASLANLKGTAATRR